MAIPTTVPKVTVSRDEIRRFLTDRKRPLPLTKLNITRAREKLKKKKEEESLPQGRDISIVRSDAPRQVVYGFSRLGGVATFMASSHGETQVNIVFSLTCHEVEDIVEVWVDEWRADFPAVPGWNSALTRADGQAIFKSVVYIEKNYGSDTQSALPGLVALNIGWTEDHRQLGVAHLRGTLLWDASVFGDGMPDFSFGVRGRKIYDPRTLTTYYNDNWALCILDYLRSTRFGLGVGDGEIDWDNFAEAANICDEAVALAGGGTEKRYTINGHFDLDEDHGAVLERMAAAGAGRICYSGGKWRVFPGAYRAPVMTLTEDDLRSEVRVETMYSKRQRFNRVRGTFPSVLERHAVVDYPPVVNATYLAEDSGEEVWSDLSYNFTTSPSACQRLSKIELERIRQGIQVQITVSLRGLELQIGDTVLLTLARMNWDAKAFEVDDIELVEVGDRNAPTIAVNLTLRETAPGIYDWNTGNETTYDIAPNTTLANPFSVSPLTDLTLTSGDDDLYVRGDGTVFSRMKATWTPSTSGFVLSGGQVQPQYKRSDSALWQTLTPMLPDIGHMYVLDVEDGVSYDFRVRAVNAFGIASEWSVATNHVVTGKSAPPDDVAGFNARVSDYNILLAWTPVTDLDIAFYEIREIPLTTEYGFTDLLSFLIAIGDAGGGDITWGEAVPIGQIKASQLSVPFKAAGVYAFFIRAVDTSGNYSTNSTFLSVPIAAPSIQSTGLVFERTDAVLSWTPTQGEFAISEYIISYGATFDSSTEIAREKTTTHRVRVGWSGTRVFWIAPKDVAGNVGVAAQLPVTILTPDRVSSFNATMLQAMIQFRWQVPPSGTLPIDHYLLRRGEVYELADELGETYSTFKNHMEIVSGTYVYWVAAVDAAGNVGPPASLSLPVTVPNDFVVRSNVALDPDDATTLNNIIIEGEFLRRQQGGFVDLFQFLRGGV